MNYNQQLEELQQRIDNTEDFLEKMELLSEFELLELRAGLRKQTRPIDYGEGCGDSCGA